MLSHLLTLLKVCLRSMCFTYGWNNARKITKYSSWSEILIFVIFRKKLAQKSSVFIKLLFSNLLSQMLPLINVYLRAIYFTHDWNVVRKITKHNSWSEILIFSIFRKKLAQKISVFIKVLLLNIVATMITLLKVYLYTTCFIHTWSTVHKIIKCEYLAFVISHKKFVQKSIVFV
jgi:hypothetical protein